ncbi:MAG: hypothetical protein ABMA01_12525 [Chthoniobacteraceae bacterium]
MPPGGAPNVEPTIRRLAGWAQAAGWRGARRAPIHAALIVDPSKELMDASRPVPITDGGKPVAALFA